MKPLLAYIWGMFWLLQCLYRGGIEIWDSAGFLAFYFIYVTGVVIGSKCFSKYPGGTDMDNLDAVSVKAN